MAGELFVDPAGDDAHAGDAGRPLRTLARAAELAQAGDTVTIGAGVYREVLRPQRSGRADAPIVFRAQAGASVVISALDPLPADAWQPHDGAILKTALTGDLPPGAVQVFHGEQMLIEARHPNITAPNLLTPKLLDMSCTEDTVIASGINRPDGYWTGAYVVGGFGSRWAWQWAQITDSKGSNLTLGDRSKPWYPGKGQAYITGTLGVLDTAGEWHMEDDTLYLWPPADADAGAPDIALKRRAWCVDFNGQSHVQVAGLTLFGGSVRMESDHCTLADCRVLYPSHFTRYSWGGLNSLGGIDQGQNGILLRGDDNTITRCHIRWSAGNGIAVQGHRNLVSHCEILDTSYAGTYSAGITLGRLNDTDVGQNRIWFNHIARAGRDCMQLYGAKDDDIRYNHIHDSGLLCRDLGVLYVWGRDGAGTRIAYNWIHDNRAGHSNPGIYLDNFCRNFVIHHNVIWNTEAAVRVNGPAEGHQIYNNTLFAAKDVGTHTYNVWPPLPMLEAQWPKRIYRYDAMNNLYLQATPDDQLVDAAADKFWLRPGAAAVAAGKLVEGYEIPYHGAAPDLGAYPSGYTPWLPGPSGRAIAPSDTDTDIQKPEPTDK